MQWWIDAGAHRRTPGRGAYAGGPERGWRPQPGPAVCEPGAFALARGRRGGIPPPDCFAGSGRRTRGGRISR
jgi:hypothetical protein